jgi:hypothetical protein
MVALSGRKEVSLPRMPEGRFSGSGLALDQEARRGALELYQRAIDLVADEVEALNRRFGEYSFDAGLVGSVGDLKNFRLGVYDVGYTTYASASERKLAQSTSKPRSDNLPSDLDLVVEVGRVDESDTGQARKIYDSLDDEYEGIAERVFRKTGVLVELGHKTPGSYSTIPLSELRDGGLLGKFSL